MTSGELHLHIGRIVVDRGEGPPTARRLQADILQGLTRPEGGPGQPALGERIATALAARLRDEGLEWTQAGGWSAAADVKGDRHGQ